MSIEISLRNLEESDCFVVVLNKQTINIIENCIILDAIVNKDSSSPGTCDMSTL
jgi:hypothetical protein